ncbi:DUF6418 domain-containing protein [Novosphingobium sp. RD2P27]|uniref:DUF6418 domain-containing protein n=1 Tax=Novosphingobium kalidii TaxID=3230299 RepID=A0ABV2CXT9_9SPHN
MIRSTSLGHPKSLPTIAAPWRKSTTALEVACLALSMAGALLGSSYWVHPVWSFVAFGNYIWLCLLLFRIEPRAVILALPFLISRLSTMVAMIMIEYGAEMFELGLVGRPGPWSNALNIYHCLFCLGLVASFKPISRMFDRRRDYPLSAIWDRYANLLSWLVLGLATLIALALIVRGLQAGFPLLAGTDRFFFRRFAADKVTLYALNFKSAISYALGFVAFVLPVTRPLRVSAGVMFVATVVLYFLFGDKFFTQLAAFAAFFGPYLYLNYRRLGRHAWRYAVGGVIALSLAGTVTTYIYSRGFTETAAATTDRLSGRMVGQGELWFLQASIGAPMLHWNRPLLERYAEAFTIKEVDLFALQNSIGPHYFSNRYAPDYLRASLHRNAGSVTYTAATEAMGLVLFGWFGLGVMMFVVGAVVGLASAYIAFAIESRSIASGIFAAYINVQLRASIVQATPWVIGSIYSMRWLCVILVFELALLMLGRSAAPLPPGKRMMGKLPRRTRRPRNVAA